MKPAGPTTPVLPPTPALDGLCCSIIIDPSDIPVRPSINNLTVNMPHLERNRP